MHVVLTGGTGSVGVELVPALLARDSLRKLTCIVRGSRPQARLVEALARAGCSELASDPRVEVVNGDLLQPELGLDDATRARLRRSMTHAIHGAASIRFDVASSESFATNTCGTKRMLELLTGARHRVRLAYLSTLFVVGRRDGAIPDGAEPGRAGFVNSYEASKWAAEDLVRGSPLDTTVFRLPLLLGRARDGYVHHYLEAHMLLEAFSRGWVPVFPGKAESSLPLMPTDVAARDVLDVFFEPGGTNRELHCLSPGESLIDYASMFEMVQAIMTERGQAAPPTPRFIGGRQWAALLQEDTGALDVAAPLFEVTADYFLLERTFAGAQHRDRMGATPCPHSWLAQVLRHCFSSRWGRTTMGATG